LFELIIGISALGTVSSRKALTVDGEWYGGRNDAHAVTNSTLFDCLLRDSVASKSEIGKRLGFGLGSTPQVWKRKLAHISREEFQVARSTAQKGSKSEGHKLIAPKICKIKIQAGEDLAALRKWTIELNKHLNLMCRRSYKGLGGDLWIILGLGNVLTTAFPLLIAQPNLPE
jgi:hypothetical protein